MVVVVVVCLSSLASVQSAEAIDGQQIAQDNAGGLVR